MKFLGLSREATSMTLGMMVAVVAFAAWWGPIWSYFLIGAAIAAPFLGIFAVAPAYFFLKRRGQLRIWWAVLVGAVVPGLPFVVIGLPGVLYTYVSAFVLFVSDDLPLYGDDLSVFDGMSYLLTPMLVLAPFGILGALVAWLLAYGFRLKPSQGPATISPDDSGAVT